MIFAHLVVHLLGQNRTFRFFYLAIVLIFVAALPLGSVTLLSVLTYQEVSKEVQYHRRFGEDWRAHYEAAHGPVSRARTRMAVAAAATVVNAGIAVWLYRQFVPAVMQGDAYASYSPGRRRRRHRRR